MLEKFRGAEGRKLYRYSMASVVAVIISVVLLVFFNGVVGLSAWVSSTLATAIAAVPNYEMNRKWAWGKSGRSHIWKEVVPFWALAFLGWGISTISVHAMEGYAKQHHFSHLMSTASGHPGVPGRLRRVVGRRSSSSSTGCCSYTTWRICRRSSMDAPASVSDPGLAAVDPELLAQARKVKGFMPDDRGSGPVPGRPGRGSKRPGAAARGGDVLRQVRHLSRRRRPGGRVRAALCRSPSRLGGKPGRVGAPRPHGRGCPHREDGYLALGSRRHRGRRSGGPRRAHRGWIDHRGRRVEGAAGVAVH